MHNTNNTPAIRIANEKLAAAVAAEKKAFQVVRLLEKYNRVYRAGTKIKQRRYVDAVAAHRDAAKKANIARCDFAEFVEKFKAGKINLDGTMRF